MDLSVVIPTLNGRQELPATLESIAETLPEAEVIVVNGPSADGTSGFVCNHPVADSVLDLPDRNPAVARNAGLVAASGDVIAFLGQGSQIESTWAGAVERAIDAGADAVTGPVHRKLEGDVTTEPLEESKIGSHRVRFFDGGNVVFVRGAIESLDGFDEGLPVGSARDAAHRLAALDRTLRWEPKAAVLRSQGRRERPHGTNTGTRSQQARSKGYRMAKNYGLSPRAVTRLFGEVMGTSVEQATAVLAGELKPSSWFQGRREALGATVRGIRAGLTARRADRSNRRNPHGLSTNTHRPVGRCET